MPHLAGQDHRRAVRAAARRADRAAGHVARARVFVVSGPSGAGKGTLIRGVLPRFAGRLRVAVSATTRSMRPGEVDGREYHFMDPARFTRLVAEGAFLEHVVYAGNHYGTLKGEVDRITAEGVSCVVEIELRGARAVRRALPGCVTVFIAPPSMAELAKRLDERGTDSPEEIATRLEVGREELAAIHEFDHHIVNVEVERAVDDLADVVARETACRPDAG